MSFGKILQTSFSEMTQFYKKFSSKSISKVLLLVVNHTHPLVEAVVALANPYLKTYQHPTDREKITSYSKI